MNSPQKETKDNAKAIDQLYRMMQDIIVRLDRLEQAQAPITPRERAPTPAHKRSGMFK